MFDIFGAVRRGLAGPHRLGRDGAEQAGRDHRLAQIVDLAAVVELAALEARQHADMLGVEGEVAFGGEAAEARARARRRAAAYRRRAGVGIELDVAQADLGEGIALLRQPQQHVGLGRLDVVGDDRPAAFERQRLAGDPGRHRLGAGDADVAEVVAVPAATVMVTRSRPGWSGSCSIDEVATAS